MGSLEKFVLNKRKHKKTLVNKGIQTAKITCEVGVKQGRLLSPLLFNPQPPGIWVIVVARGGGQASHVFEIFDLLFSDWLIYIFHYFTCKE